MSNPSSHDASASNQEAASTNEGLEAAALDQVMSGHSDETEHLQTELQEAKEQVLRIQAEMENFRKRMIREVEQQLRFAALPMAQDLLDIVDNLGRALQSGEATGDGASVIAGVRMVHQQFLQVLQKHHCQPIAALGQTFDPHLHQAISQAPSDQYAAGVICFEASTGYKMHDRVIRPSQVIVSTGSASGESHADV